MPYGSVLNSHSHPLILFLQQTQDSRAFVFRIEYIEYGPVSCVPTNY